MSFQLDPGSIGGAMLLLTMAFFLAFPIAWNREKEFRRVGLRTLPLVAVASCGYLLLGLGFASDNPDALARLIQGLMTGIGFVGGGAILKSSKEIRGTATAAAIWATGAVGAGVAFQRFELAIAISAVTFLTFLALTPLGRKIQEDNGEEEE